MKRNLRMKLDLQWFAGESEKGLIEQRNDLLDEMDTIVNKVKTENRAFVNEEVTRIEAIKEEIKSIDTTIKLMEETRQLEKSPIEIKKPVEVRHNEHEVIEAEKRQFMSIIRGEKIEARADVLTSTAQGVIIPKTISTQIIEVVKNLSPIFSMATMYNISGDLLIPSYDYQTHIPAYYIDDLSTVIPSVSTNFGQVTLTNQIVATRTLISKSLINRTDIDVVPMIVRMIAQAFAHFIEKELVSGAGGVGKMDGLAQIAAGQQLAGGTTLVISPQEILKLMMKVPQAFQGAGSFIMHPLTLAYLQGLTAGAGNNTLIMGNTLAEGSPFTLFGKQVYVSDNMPQIGVGAKEIYYGDFSGLSVKMASQIGVQVLMEKYADIYAVGIIGTAELDSIITDPQKIVAYVGL